MLNPFLFIIFILGLVNGSFLNVIIDRLPKNLTIIKGRSFCDHCKKTLQPIDLIPVFSFFFLKGRCRFCHKKISPYYLIVELLSGLNFLLAYLFFPPVLHQPLSFLNFLLILSITSLLIVIFFTDLKYLLIPDQILIFLLIATFLKIFLNPDFNFFTQSITAFASFSFFYAIAFLTKEKGLGGGDVKLSFIIGLLNKPLLAIASFYLAFLTGAVTGVILILTGKKKFGQKIAFGPFLALGCYLALFLQEELTKIIYLIFGF